MAPALVPTGNLFAGLADVSNATAHVPPDTIIAASPSELLEVRAQSGPPVDSLLRAATSAPGGRAGGFDRDGLTRRGAEESTEWRGRELLSRIISSAKPRYPDALRSANVAGRVLVRFTVDTAGRIDQSTVEVLGSTNDLFSEAVKRVLPSFRFRPAEINGIRVRSVAEMPFEFAVTP